MSQDIVERLRVFEADPVLGSPISEAADTIESLRARVAELEAEVTSYKRATDLAYKGSELEAHDQLAAKDQRIAELEAMFNAERRACHAIESQWAEMMLQLAAQALTIKTLRESLEAAKNGLTWWMDNLPHDVTEADYEEMERLETVLALPDNSTEVLQEWLDKQLGEPVAKFNWNTGAFVWLIPYSHREHHNQPLYRKPEIKK